MSIPAAFANMAECLSAMASVPFFDSVAKWPGTPTLDSGGSITAAGTPVNVDCKVQVDTATDSMRRDAAFVEGDVRLLVLGYGLAQDIDTNCRIDVQGGPYQGVWAVQSVTRDPAGIGFECRGRKWD